MLRIVTDSAADMPANWLTEFDIHMVPVNIHFGGDTYLHGVTIDETTFYRRVEQLRIIPKTSQPSPGQFIETYRKVASKGDTILSIHVTSKLSGTCQSAEYARREVGGDYNVVVFDSLCGSLGIGFMCREARLMDWAGKSLPEIVARLEALRDSMCLTLTLDTLKYAQMSGRVGALQGALASMLNVKPIIILKDGVLEAGERVRTRKRALDHILNLIKRRVGDKPVNVAVVHAVAPDEAVALADMTHKALNVKELLINSLSVAVAVQLGPGTLGLVAYEL